MRLQRFALQSALWDDVLAIYDALADAALSDVPEESCNSSTPASRVRANKVGRSRQEGENSIEALQGSPGSPRLGVTILVVGC